MARTTATLVEKILLDDYGPDQNMEWPDLGPFIESATVIVDRVAVCATERGKALLGSELELIERWLAAHAYVMSDQPYTERQTEKARGKFQGQTGMYLEASKYGQMAVTLDPSGCLSAIATSTKKTASLLWLGLPPSSQTPYRHRY